jgi:hypothetical protein
MPHSTRQAEWGHWGITFFTKVPGDYAPTTIDGVLYFPVGTRGPMDGLLGSPERQKYAEAIKNWMEQGVLPDGVQNRHWS